MKFKYSLFALALATAPFSWAHDVHWSYQSPDQWADISSDFAICKSGHNQSPVDIRHLVKGQLAPLELEYQARQQSIINNGHTIQINVQDGDQIQVDDEAFTLRQFHFHTPGENKILGKVFPLEAHFVHSSSDHALAVVGVMFEEGAANPALEEILRNVPATVNQQEPLQKGLNLTTLIPASKDYYRFSGSLTTPPCTEGVRWLIMKETVKASPAQIAAFVKLLGEDGNSRPVQSLNGRIIVG